MVVTTRHFDQYALIVFRRVPHSRSSVINICLEKSFNPNSLGILARNHPRSSKIHLHAIKTYPYCWTLMELVQWQMEGISWLGYTQS